MDNDDKKIRFDASLPLPGQNDDQAAKTADEKPEEGTNPAADLIRQRIEAAYKSEPDIDAEAKEVETISPTTQLSEHQQFVNTLMNSGKSLADIQTAWHEYYVSLPDDEKHRVWQEFYDLHAQSSSYASAAKQVLPPAPMRHHVEPTEKKSKKHPPAEPRAVKTYKPPKHFQSLLFGLLAGVGAVIIVLFGFFNERFIAPFIQPSRNVTNIPLISDASAAGNTPEVIIPKINVEIPVVYDVSTIDDNAIESALENGVVHYADTAVPGQNGNVVIVGHSSNNIFNKGKYKFAFVLLSRLENGDTFYLQKDGKRYTYQVYKKSIVGPNDTSVLGLADRQATATLITCDPPGTSINRLVVVGEQISPNPASNSAQVANNSLATQTSTIPGNAESLWHRLTHIFSR